MTNSLWRLPKPSGSTSEPEFPLVLLGSRDGGNLTVINPSSETNGIQEHDTVGPRKLEYGSGTNQAGFSSSLGFGLGGQSYSTLMASTVHLVVPRFNCLALASSSRSLRKRDTYPKP